jgi:hypothetical protein
LQAACRVGANLGGYAAVTKTNEHWNVLPHGPLTPIGGNMLTVEGRIKMPLTELPRRMTVVRLHDGRLVVWSAIALGEPSMAALEAFGTPHFLVVPSDHHRLDAHAWKARYPDMQVVAPVGARDKVADVVAVDTTEPEFGDDNVEFVTVPGTKGHEAALVVRAPGATTLVLNDLVGNIRAASGIDGWLLRLAGFAGDDAQIPRVIKAAVVKDAADLRTQLLQWAELPALTRVIVSHGEPIEHEPRDVLRGLAASLD